MQEFSSGEKSPQRIRNSRTWIKKFGSKQTPDRGKGLSDRVLSARVLAGSRVGVQPWTGEGVTFGRVPGGRASVMWVKAVLYLKYSP